MGDCASLDIPLAQSSIHSLLHWHLYRNLFSKITLRTLHRLCVPYVKNLQSVYDTDWRLCTSKITNKCSEDGNDFTRCKYFYVNICIPVAVYIFVFPLLANIHLQSTRHTNANYLLLVRSASASVYLSVCACMCLPICPIFSKLKLPNSIGTIFLSACSSIHQL